jgi:GT2 family glycosyltransferase
MGVKTSVVTALFNRLDLTQSFWRSLLSNPPTGLWEMVWIDDRSTDGTRDWLNELEAWSWELRAKSFAPQFSGPSDSADPAALINKCSNPPLNIRVILNDSNLGYAANNNLGAQAAKGDTLVFLNNDLILTPGWFEPLVNVFNENLQQVSLSSQFKVKVGQPETYLNLKLQPPSGLRRLGIVGNVQLQVSTGLVDHAGVYFDLVGMPVHKFKNRHRTVLQTDGISCRAVTAACWCVRREVFLEAGGFDTAYRNGFEDIDLCLRLGQLGYTHWVDYRSVIWHHVSSSPGRTKHNDVNRVRFLKQWAGMTAKFGQEEWPREYLARVFRDPLKLNLYKTVDALLRIVGLRKGDSAWSAKRRDELCELGAGS